MEDNVVDNFAPIGPWEDDQDKLRKRIADLKENGPNGEVSKQKQFNKVIEEREEEQRNSALLEDELAVKKALSILAGDYNTTDNHTISKTIEIEKKEKSVPKVVKTENVDGKKVYNFYNCTITFN